MAVSYSMGVMPKEYGYTDARGTTGNKEQAFIVQRALPQLKVEESVEKESITSSQGAVTASFRDLAEAMLVLERLCDTALLAAVPEVCQMRSEIPASSRGTSALDCFLYHNDRPEHQQIGCAEHVDPGLVTIAPTSSVQGLEVKDASTGEWVQVEEACRTAGGEPSVVMFAGKLLARLCAPEAGGHITATLHRVVCHGGEERSSLLYEARLREADVAGWLVAREVAAMGL